jgi:molybdopterin-guanine dinucleotide biosynthesis protein A
LIFHILGFDEIPGFCNKTMKLQKIREKPCNFVIMLCRTCAILAGGAARRFGGLTKSKIIVGGKTVIERILETVSGMFGEILIVTNSPFDFEEYKCTLVPDVITGIGPLGGIHAALRSAGGEAVFVLAGDMPLLSSDLMAKQLNFYEKGKFDIVTPRTGIYLEPLHSIYRTSVAEVIEENVSGDKIHAVYDLFSLVNVGYYEHGDPHEARVAFTNINSPGDVIKVEGMLMGRR